MSGCSLGDSVRALLIFSVLHEHDLELGTLQFIG